MTTKSKSKTATKQVRNQYSDELKRQAVLHAAQDGVGVVAKDLGLAESQLYAWRAKTRLSGQMSEHQRVEHSEHARLKREVARVEEENAFLKKAAAYFAKQPK